MDIQMLIADIEKDNLFASLCFMKLKVKLGADITLYEYAIDALILHASAWLTGKIYSWSQTRGLL